MFDCFTNILIVLLLAIAEAMQRPHILLIRLSAIGDIVMASGLPSSIKAAYPGARVCWLVESPYVELVKHHPGVDHVIAWPKNHWQQLHRSRQYTALYRAVTAFVKQLRNEHFDIAIEAQGLIKSALIARLSGARCRIGFVSKEHSHRLLTEAISKPVSDDFGSEYKALAQHMGSDYYHPHLTIDAATSQRLYKVLRQKQIPQHFVVLCPFTTRAQKHWPLERWQQLIILLRAQYRGALVILGGPGDAATAEQFAVATGIYQLAGALSLAESLACIARAQALVGVDTGMTHAATVLSTPAVALFGSTCPYLRTPSSTTRVVYLDLPCAPCKRRPTCQARYDCLVNITAPRVWHTLQQVLK